MTSPLFIIVSTRRVGSTALSLMLDNSPDVSCSGEMVYKGEHCPRLKSKHILVSNGQNITSLIPKSDKKIWGCKMTIPDYQASDMSRISDLAKTGNVKVIHLSRNLLEQYVSLKVAKLTGVWHAKHPASCAIPEWVGADHQVINNIRIETNLVEIHEFCQNVIEIDNKITNLKNLIQYIHINHNQLNDAAQFSRICNFLHATEPAAFESELKETTTNHIKQIEHVQGAIEVFETYERNRY